MSVSGSGGTRDAAGNLTTRPDWLLPPFFFASAVGNNSATFMAKKRRHVFNFFFYESQLYRGHWRCLKISTVCTFTIIILGV